MFKFSKKGPKKPRFFCESCGAEVSRGAEQCTKCGKFFTSVRCPACEYTGEEDLFREGCPICGYSVERNSEVNLEDFSEPPKPIENLPFWAYILTAAAFTAVLAALLRTIS